VLNNFIFAAVGVFLCFFFTSKGKVIGDATLRFCFFPELWHLSMSVARPSYLTFHVCFFSTLMSFLECHTAKQSQYFVTPFQ
jgi:hypothetical protein